MMKPIKISSHLTLSSSGSMIGKVFFFFCLPLLRIVIIGTLLYAPFDQCSSRKFTETLLVHCVHFSNLRVTDMNFGQMIRMS